MAELSEVLSRLKAIEQKLDGSSHPPIIDPTANVLSLVSAAITRQDDLRTQAEAFKDKLDSERRRAESEARQAESGRIDALLAANTNNVALALEKQGAQAQAQDRRLAAVEQNQYQGVGSASQRTDNRQSNQWAIMLAFGILVLIVDHFWK